MKIKCIITDDEPIARKGLRGYIEKVDFLTLTGECEDAVQLNTILKTQEIDLLFLDIEMPEMTGIELLSNLTNPPKVIIVSAYEQYALKGYEFNVVDYLLNLYLSIVLSNLSTKSTICYKRSKKKRMIIYL